MEAELAAIEQQLEEMREEHGIEGGLLEEVVDEKGKISAKALGARRKAIGEDTEFEEERLVLAAVL